MSKLTSKAVNKIFKDCLFKEDEDKSKAVIAEGVLNNFGFHPERLQAHKAEIRQLLKCLPDTFQPGKGDGWSFLNACVDNDGIQWGEHVNVEQLLVLGIATGQAQILLPRKMWKVLPGGLPYFGVTAK